MSTPNTILSVSGLEKTSSPDPRQNAVTLTLEYPETDVRIEIELPLIRAIRLYMGLAKAIDSSMNAIGDAQVRHGTAADAAYEAIRKAQS